MDYDPYKPNPDQPPQLSDLLGLVAAQTPLLTANMEATFAPGSATRAAMLKQQRIGDRYNVFNLDPTSRLLAAGLLRDTDTLDVISMGRVVRGHHLRVVEMLVDLGLHTNEGLTSLNHAVEQQLVHHLTPSLLPDTPNVATTAFNEYLRMSEDWLMEPLEEAFLRLDTRIHDKHAIAHVTAEGCLVTTEHPEAVNEYNTALTEQNRRDLDTHAAEAIERLHLLKAYEPRPSIISGSAIDFNWDISVVRAVNDIEGNAAKGAIADFFFLPQGKTFKSHITEIDDRPYNRRLVNIGGSDTALRLRLHDNGQISSGHEFHNIPSDITEETFALLGAADAFVRIRALCIALAFDSMAPQHIVEGAGGSVVDQFTTLGQDGDIEPLIALLQSRELALRQTGVSVKKRQAKGWGTPANEGQLRKTSYQHAHFRRTKITNQNLGSLGIRTA